MAKNAKIPDKCATEYNCYIFPNRQRQTVSFLDPAHSVSGTHRQLENSVLRARFAQNASSCRSFDVLGLGNRSGVRGKHPRGHTPFLHSLVSHRQSRSGEVLCHEKSRFPSGDGREPAHSSSLGPRIRRGSLRSKLSAKVDAKQQIRLTGILRAERKSHSIVILDSVPKIQGAYWQELYVGRVQRDGAFEVTITEPLRAQGTLKLLVCFENGAATGGGLNYGIRGALEKPCVVDGRTFVLDPRPVTGSAKNRPIRNARAA